MTIDESVKNKGVKWFEELSPGAIFKRPSDYGDDAILLKIINCTDKDDDVIANSVHLQSGIPTYICSDEDVFPLSNAVLTYKEI